MNRTLFITLAFSYILSPFLFEIFFKENGDYFTAGLIALSLLFFLVVELKTKYISQTAQHFSTGGRYIKKLIHLPFSKYFE
ncbi:MAG: hypothetical protein A2836_00335 [Candidatus Taylorbacteria bacterium RIFCSPHIGHO2_01_FULL_45_63]|uniref:Uncharacterized protein n=1 Tax=Candidatus Taylorbacteria bacterium RIFCSPHIGHO2_02_FULL_45_35 TaxID=1802311 RepID=A0A1G2MUR9_9BACT|nr:MAG: hypothetical protein A2836_00335 [Candidatus Taylorbacteria bacterium RIFCSPHIGHO2_01_FULL_45_63]OHA26832.1 MAG: hypothetical protein A3D56_02800 [Candidatus Taylorbacteria bacterium RIFCSPHIGHO2_02_FULL_45_35]OHA33607.1 MAG: hypothetical protein A3A22_03355 [Candidatus Taylorbacteria bacterium RIFCSPLOWO2_01_FULL_45_34b]